MERSTINAEILGVKDGMPIIAAVRIGPDLVFRCPLCDHVHAHGVRDNETFSMADGSRLSHCRHYSEKPATMYWLQEVRDRWQAGTLTRRSMERKNYFHGPDKHIELDQCRKVT